jgi:hypothetical protein
MNYEWAIFSMSHSPVPIYAANHHKTSVKKATTKFWILETIETFRRRVLLVLRFVEFHPQRCFGDDFFARAQPVGFKPDTEGGQPSVVWMGWSKPETKQPHRSHWQISAAVADFLGVPAVEGVLNHAATLLFNFDFRLGSILRKYQSLTKKKLNMIEEEKGSYVRSVRTPSSDRSSVTATRLCVHFT